MTNPASPVISGQASASSARGWVLIGCGVLSLLGAATSYALVSAHYIAGALVLVGAAVALVVGNANRIVLTILVGLQVLCAIPLVLPSMVSPSVLNLWFTVVGSWFGLMVVLAIASLGVIVLGIVALASRPRAAQFAGPPDPAGYDANGEPFYPIVGYRPDGSPVTADQAPGYRPTVSGTNSMAIAAIVCAVIFAPLAIPFGHIARSQIRRTGEQGSGIALAALVIGYLGLVSVVVAIGFSIAVLNGMH